MCCCCSPPATAAAGETKVLTGNYKCTQVPATNGGCTILTNNGMGKTKAKGKGKEKSSA
jgi:hypothetical protein